MTARPKLTRAMLHEIGRQKNAADIPTELWEIHRLRGIALRPDQVQKMLGSMGGAQGMVLDGLRSELEGEPCVAEFPRMPE